MFYLDPFDPRDYAGRKAIAAEARARIIPALEARLGKSLRVFGHPVGPVGYVPPDKAA